MSSPVPSGREQFLLHALEAAPIALQVQRAALADAPDVLYVHGATFGADLSVFFPFDGVSWADALTQAGRHAWGFDFTGFGALGRYPPDATQPAGAMDDALQDLRSAQGCMCASDNLASDPASGTRSPPAVLTPAGPLADIAALWSGQALYDPAKVQAPTLLVRGEWDTLCTDGDARRLLSALAAPIGQDVKIPRATHLMHLEQQRSQLHATVNRFLEEVSA